MGEKQSSIFLQHCIEFINHERAVVATCMGYTFNWFWNNLYVNVTQIFSVLAFLHVLLIIFLALERAW